MFWQKKLWMVKAIYSEDCLSKKVMVGMDDKTWKRFMFYVAPCGEHFFIVSERDSGEILHAIGDRCNFGLSKQSAKKLKFQPQGRWELVWMQNRHRSNTGEGLQSQRKRGHWPYSGVQNLDRCKCRFQQFYKYRFSSAVTECKTWTWKMCVAFRFAILFKTLACHADCRILHCFHWTDLRNHTNCSSELEE